jgi:hypothetical protein
LTVPHQEGGVEIVNERTSSNREGVITYGSNNQSKKNQLEEILEEDGERDSKRMTDSIIEVGGGEQN